MTNSQELMPMADLTNELQGKINKQSLSTVINLSEVENYKDLVRVILHGNLSALTIFEKRDSKIRTTFLSGLLGSQDAVTIVFNANMWTEFTNLFDEMLEVLIQRPAVNVALSANAINDVLTISPEKFNECQSVYFNTPTDELFDILTLIEDMPTYLVPVQWDETELAVVCGRNADSELIELLRLLDSIEEINWCVATFIVHSDKTPVLYFRFRTPTEKEVVFELLTR